eukprot:IDg6743t1
MALSEINKLYYGSRQAIACTRIPSGSARSDAHYIYYPSAAMHRVSRTIAEKGMMRTSAHKQRLQAVSTGAVHPDPMQHSLEDLVANIALGWFNALERTARIDCQAHNILHPTNTLSAANRTLTRARSCTRASL